MPKNDKPETLFAQIRRHPHMPPKQLAEKLCCKVATVHIARYRQKLKRDLSVVEIVRRNLANQEDA